MDITISKHAAERAVERGISEEDIFAIVRGDVFSVAIPSKHDPTAFTLVGLCSDKLCGIVVNRNTNNVITVRRAQTKEERIYYDR